MLEAFTEFAYIIDSKREGAAAGGGGEGEAFTPANF